MIDTSRRITTCSLHRQSSTCLTRSRKCWTSAGSLCWWSKGVARSSLAPSSSARDAPAIAQGTCLGYSHLSRFLSLSPCNDRRPCSLLLCTSRVSRLPLPDSPRLSQAPISSKLSRLPPCRAGCCCSFLTSFFPPNPDTSGRRLDPPHPPTHFGHPAPTLHPLCTHPAPTLLPSHPHCHCQRHNSTNYIHVLRVVCHRCAAILTTHGFSTAQVNGFRGSLKPPWRSILTTFFFFFLSLSNLITFDTL